MTPTKCAIVPTTSLQPSLIQAESGNDPEEAIPLAAHNLFPEPHSLLPLSEEDGFALLDPLEPVPLSPDLSVSTWVLPVQPYTLNPEP